MTCLAALEAGRCCAQSCPSESKDGPLIESAPQTVTGHVHYHDGIRQWLELVPPKPVCGYTSIQLLGFGGGAFEVDRGNANQLERYRDCDVTVVGPIGIPSTGYYSAPIYLTVNEIDPTADCSLKSAPPDFSKLKPSSAIRRYRVTFHIRYEPGDHPVSAVITNSNGQALRPWQEYASYTLTGGFVFYANCAKGFRLSHVTGTPQAHPGRPDENMAGMDPESAGMKHVTNLRLSFSCRR